MSQEKLISSASDVFGKLEAVVQNSGSENRLEVNLEGERLLIGVGTRRSLGEIKVDINGPSGDYSVTLTKEGPRVYSGKCPVPGLFSMDLKMRGGMIFSQGTPPEQLEDSSKEVEERMVRELRMRGYQVVYLNPQQANELVRQLFYKIEPVLNKAGIPITS